MNPLETRLKENLSLTVFISATKIHSGGMELRLKSTRHRLRNEYKFQVINLPQ